MLHPNKTINDIFYAICLIIIGPVGWVILAIVVLLHIFVEPVDWAKKAEEEAKKKQGGNQP